MPTDSDAASLLDDLTPPQVQAVTHVDGPLLVLAGPGSGKTRVITRRIAYLVREVGIAPWQICAITFTNKAAGEMAHRVGELLSEAQARAATICTFHSLCVRILRKHGQHVDLPPGFSIYDSDDQQRLIKQALTELNINSSNFSPQALLSAISNAKNELISPEQYAADASDFFTRKTASVYTKYQQLLQANQAVDFDDLLMKTVELLKARQDVLAQLQQRFQYLLIDEYQDTNHAQFVIAHALASGHHNICATGDPDQSIYAWRGADIRNILQFETRYPNAVIVRLEQNYRSTKAILSLADSLIQRNAKRKHKSLWTDNEDGDLPVVLWCQDEQHEAECLVEHLIHHHDKLDIPWSDMAVFYRVNSLSRVIEDKLRAASVPYQIARGTSFYDRKEVRDALAYLKVIANPLDEISLLRIINTPTRGIGQTTIQTLRAHAAASGRSLYDTLRDASQAGIHQRGLTAVRKFEKMLAGWIKQADPDTPPPLGAHASLRQFFENVMRESKLEESVANDKSDPEQERLANLGELISSAQQFDDEFDAQTDVAEPANLAIKLQAYLDRVSLVSDVDAVDPQEGAVTLMTLHAAKGLEYASVVIAGCEQGLLPHSRAVDDKSQMEEERRLCFVGITRARRFLLLTHTQFRTVFGTTMPAIPSQFIEELPTQGYEHKRADLPEDAFGSGGANGGRNSSRFRSRAARSGSGASASQTLASGPNPFGIEPGMWVEHPNFGRGRVLGVKNQRGGNRAQVRFPSGVKTLILEYARLEVVED